MRVSKFFDFLVLLHPREGKDKKRTLRSKTASLLTIFGAVGAGFHLSALLLALLWLRSYDVKVAKMIEEGVTPMSTSGRNIIVGHIIGALLGTGFFLLLLSIGILLKHIEKRDRE